MGDDLKNVWAKLSILSWAVFVMSAITRNTQACPCLHLKTRHSLCPVSLSLSILEQKLEALSSLLPNHRSVSETDLLKIVASSLHLIDHSLADFNITESYLVDFLPSC